MSISKEYPEQDNVDIFQGVSKVHLRFLQSKNYVIEIVTGDETTTTRLDMEHFLGKGITSTVLKTETGEAAKIFFPVDGQINYPKIFSNEATLHIKINHPNVARADRLGKIRIGSGTEVPCLIKEYLPFGLKEKIGKRQLSVEESIKMIGEIASATQYIYQETGKVIVDLSPDNIRQRENGQWVLSEIGHAVDKNSKPEDEVYDKVFSDPDFVNRNTIRQENIVYSLSLILWQSLTSEKLNDDIHIGSIKDTIKQNQIPEPIFKIIQAGLRITDELEIKSPLDFYKKILAAFENTQEQS